MRVVIVDDEAPARSRLRQLLAAHSDVEVVGEAETGAAAMAAARELQPDVMLLDIQMPEGTGVDVAASLSEPRPRLIFCTAYEQHAVDAFELAAVDYLLKPISRARLAQALGRVRALEGGGQKPAVDQAAKSSARFLIRSGDRYVVIGSAQVLYFLAEDGQTRMVCAGAKYWMDPALNDLEARLEASRFFRISRAALVQLSAVQEVCPMPGGSGEVVMKNGDRLEVSRRRYRDLLGALEG